MNFLTMHERSHKPYDEITYAFVGDGRFNMGRSLLVTGAIMGSDVRLVTPGELRPPDDVAGADFVHTDVWVSMGEPKEVWNERSRLLTPYQVNAGLLAATRNPKVKFMHCLPAFHDAETTVGREIAEATGMRSGIEVTDDVFRSPASIVFDQAENRLHTIKSVLVATLA